MPGPLINSSVGSPGIDSAITIRSIGDEIRSQVSTIRNSIPNVDKISVLHIGREETAVAVGNGFEPVAILVLAIGSQKTAREYFKHTPPTPLELENAIQTVEDEIACARTLIPDGSGLYTTDAAVREVAMLSGVKESPEMILSLEAVEQTFDRMASVTLGASVSHAGLPESIEFAAMLLILREFMHHMKIVSIICVNLVKTVTQA